MAMIFASAGPVLEESVSAVTATPTRSVGDRVSFAGEEYVYCFNAGGGTIAVGNGVKLVTACSGYSVAATSLTDICNPCVGVVKHTAIAAASYGWVMTRGFASVVVVTALTGDFLPIALGAAGTFIRSLEPVTAVDTVGGTALVAGFALNANTGNAGTVYAYIKGFGS